MLHSSCETGVRKRKKNQTCRYQGRVGGAPGTGAEDPLPPVEKALVKQVVPLQAARSLACTKLVQRTEGDVI